MPPLKFWSCFGCGNSVKRIGLWHSPCMYVFNSSTYSITTTFSIITPLLYKSFFWHPLQNNVIILHSWRHQYPSCGSLYNRVLVQIVSLLEHFRSKIRVAPMEVSTEWSAFKHQPIKWAWWGVTNDYGTILLSPTKQQRYIRIYCKKRMSSLHV